MKQEMRYQPDALKKNLLIEARRNEILFNNIVDAMAAAERTTFETGKNRRNYCLAMKSGCKLRKNGNV